MNKFLTIFFAMTVVMFINSTCFAFTPTKPHKIRIDNTELRLAQMRYYSHLTVKDYEKLKGKKLNLFEKLSFKTSQHRMKSMLKSYDRDGTVSVLQKISWCAKGLLLGPLALLLGYIFLKDEERELIKWIWYGFAGWVAVLALFLILI